MQDLTVRVCFGPSAADQRERVVEVDTLVGALITYWKKDFHLPEQDTSGEMIRYALYREQGASRELLDKNRSLRLLRVKPYEVLYLTDERRLWWSGASSPSRPLPPPPVPDRFHNGPATDDLTKGQGIRKIEPLPMGSGGSKLVQQPPPPPLRPSGVIPCSIELAPSCVVAVPESGLIINRDYLMGRLPASVSARERLLVLMGLQSRIESVSRDPEGHCALIYRHGWYLRAIHTLFIGSNKHSHGEAILLDQTVTLLLGRDGWPITIRLHSTQITR